MIGNAVRPGRSATVPPGVHVGDGAVVTAHGVVTAHSVVTKDVPAYAVVAGDPARQVRTRSGPDEVASPLRTRWWTWPLERITAHAALIVAGTPAELAAARPRG
ncbi:LbetaH domain-containing protein [Kineococcus indalonis]|uniref:hypothetical protein n=1 Tax=Kineococcus indalonis TaxID=2696566 RepID=UPI00196ADD91|nr:hypothetical protein [Kineococcus indalonis]